MRNLNTGFSDIAGNKAGSKSLEREKTEKECITVLTVVKAEGDRP